MTSKKATIAGLLAMGWFEYDPERVMRPSGTRMKYRIFSKVDAGHQLLVCGSGALRMVPTGGTIAGSLSLTGSRIHHAICEVGNPRFRWESPQQAEEVYLRLQADRTLTFSEVSP